MPYCQICVPNRRRFILSRVPAHSLLISSSKKLTVAVSFTPSSTDTENGSFISSLSARSTNLDLSSAPPTAHPSTQPCDTSRAATRLPWLQLTSFLVHVSLCPCRQFCRGRISPPYQQTTHMFQVQFLPQLGDVTQACPIMMLDHCLRGILASFY